MPSNATQTITILVPLSDTAEYFFSLQDTAAILSEIPAGGGTALSLPTNVHDGDNFAFYDADGSCSPGNPVFLSGQGVWPVQGQAALAFVAPYSWAIATFAEKLGVWVVQSGGAAGSGSLLALPWTAVAAGATVHPTALQPWLSIDTSGGVQVTIEMPSPAVDGQVLLAVDNDGNAAVNPILFTSAGGVTIDNPQNPGAYANAVTFTTQGGTVAWKYKASTQRWIFFSI